MELEESNIQVVCRIRPMNSREERLDESLDDSNIVHIGSDGKTIHLDSINDTYTDVNRDFSFDQVFSPDSTQEDVFQTVGRPIVEDVLKGYNATIFAYGQTSCGKTYTMQGSDVCNTTRGMAPRVLEQCYEHIANAPASVGFRVKMSYFEIYMEKIHDLLADGGHNLRIRETRHGSLHVEGLTEEHPRTLQQAMDILNQGLLRQRIQFSSSKRNFVLMMEVTQTNLRTDEQTIGKLCLVELQGSEKVKKTGASGSFLTEAQSVSRTFSSLGLVIQSLTMAKNHIPYRDSKLTRLLKESLGGNAKTTFILCCSPASGNIAETLSTLRFGTRARKVKNKVRINLHKSQNELEKMVSNLQQENSELRHQMEFALSELRFLKSLISNGNAEKVNVNDQQRHESSRNEPQKQERSDEELRLEAHHRAEERSHPCTTPAEFISGKLEANSLDHEILLACKSAQQDKSHNPIQQSRIQFGADSHDDISSEQLQEVKQGKQYFDTGVEKDDKDKSQMLQEAMTDMMDSNED